MVKRDQQSDSPRRQGYPSAPGRRKINDRFTATHNFLSSYQPAYQTLQYWSMSPTVCDTKHSMQKTTCACLEIPSTGSRPAGMLAKNTLHQHMGVLFLESYNSNVRMYRPGYYTRGMSVCSGPCPSGDTTNAMSAGRPCLTIFFFFLSCL